MKRISIPVLLVMVLVVWVSGAHSLPKNDCVLNVFLAVSTTRQFDGVTAEEFLKKPGIMDWLESRFDGCGQVSAETWEKCSQLHLSSSGGDHYNQRENVKLVSLICEHMRIQR